MEDRSSGGPYATERQAAAAVRHITGSPGEAWGPGLHKHLEDACSAAGVELGAYDHQILLWLADYPPAVVAVVAGLIGRANGPGAREQALGPAGVAQPGGGWISGPST
jgi:hypothetical protein